MSTTIQTVRRTIVAIAAVTAMAFTATAQADIVVQEFAATFAEIEADNTAIFTLADGEVTLSAPGDISGVTIDDLQVDLTSYIAPLGLPGDVIVGGNNSQQITLRSGGTTAMYDVIDAQLTQILNAPIGVGYIELNLSLDGGALSYNTENVVLNDVIAVITLNGLVIDNGIAYTGVLSTASLSAVPEPSTVALAMIGLLGFVGYGLRTRGRKNS